MLSKKEEQRSFSNGPLRDQWEQRAQSMADQCKQETEWKEKSALKGLFSKWTYHWSLSPSGDKMKDEMSDFSKLTSRKDDDNNKPRIKFKIVPPPPKPKPEPPPPPPPPRKKASPKPRRPKRKVEVDVFRLCWRESWMSLKAPKYLFLKAKELKTRTSGFATIKLTNNETYKAKGFRSEADLTSPHEKWSHSWKQVKSPAQLEHHEGGRFQWDIVFERKWVFEAEIEKYSLPIWAGTWKIMNFAFRQQKKKWDCVWPNYQQHCTKTSDRLQQLETQDEPTDWDSSWKLSEPELELNYTTDNETLAVTSSINNIAVRVRIDDVFLPGWSNSWLLSEGPLEDDEERQQSWCFSWGYRQQIRWRKASLKSHHRHSTMLTKSRESTSLFLTSHLDDEFPDVTEWIEAWTTPKGPAEPEEEELHEEEEEDKEVEQMKNDTEEDKDEGVDNMVDVGIDDQDEKDEGVDEEEEEEDDDDEAEDQEEEEEVDEDEGEEKDEGAVDVDKHEEDGEARDGEMHKKKEDKDINKLDKEDKEDEDEGVDEEEEEEEEDKVIEKDEDIEVEGEEKKYLHQEQDSEQEDEEEDVTEEDSNKGQEEEVEEDKRINNRCEEDEVVEQVEDSKAEEEEKKDLDEEEDSEEEDSEQEDEEQNLAEKNRHEVQKEEDINKCVEEDEVDEDGDDVQSDKEQMDEEEDEELDVKNEVSEDDEEKDNDDKEIVDEDDQYASRTDKDHEVEEKEMKEDEEEDMKEEGNHGKVEEKENKKMLKQVKPDVPLHLQFHKLNASFSSWRKSWVVAEAYRGGEDNAGEEMEVEEGEEDWWAWKESWRIYRWKKPDEDEVACFSTEHRCQRYMGLMHEEDGMSRSEWTLSWALKTAVMEEDSEEDEEEEEEEEENAS